MAATFQNLSGGRLLLNVVTGGESREQRAYGDFVDKEGRYRRCDEFPEIVTGLWTGEAVTFDGEFLRVESAQLQQLPDPIPEIYFGGSSPAAGDVAGQARRRLPHRGEPPAAVAKKIARIRELAEQQGREVRFGLRIHTINRDTSEEARHEADRLLEGIDEATIAKVREGLKQSESVGQRNMLALNRGSKDNLEIHPNVWAGVGLVRGGAGTAFVGSHSEVADRIEEYAALGIDEFVLSAYPHLEGAYQFGEGVLPILEQRGVWQHPSPVAATSSVPFGAQRAAS
ncbi:LLM class flavin-dependent oxidoreductase [Nocardioides sp. B-3]|uniref:LLM class flavin-dependent oxidoreductase n=1 Tax=Nocardioides sp. B-3 TaxID=2895565 RepID=UPI002152DA36|nr:LLM class flavin-dependent oxidoreductase [Nocardioides sp. B-3]